MVKIEFRQKNKDGTETIVYNNQENPLESVIFVGTPPRVLKLYVVPKDKLKEILGLIYEGKYVPLKYTEERK